LEELIVNGGTTNLSRAYTYGLNLISQRQPGVSSDFFVCDGHGSTRLLTDAGGNVVNAFAYDAYGNMIASNAASQTAYLYCAQQFDFDFGLYYHRARYLNNGTGRFWTGDTFEGDNEDPVSLHKYLYAGDDPVNRIDPKGTDAMFIFANGTRRKAETLAQFVTIARNAGPRSLASIEMDGHGDPNQQTLDEKDPPSDLEEGLLYVAGYHKVYCFREHDSIASVVWAYPDAGTLFSGKFSTRIIPSASIKLRGCSTAKVPDSIAENLSKQVKDVEVWGSLEDSKFPSGSAPEGIAIYYNGALTHARSLRTSWFGTGVENFDGEFVSDLDIGPF
jgi:RHS repeat-associated protein